MPNCIVVVQFDLPKRSEELAVKGGTSTAPTYRGLAGMVYRRARGGIDQALWGPASPHLVRHIRDGRQFEGRDPRQRQGD